jgi:anion-transporting  ArsA/GET3 family ATPase
MCLCIDGPSIEVYRVIPERRSEPAMKCPGMLDKRLLIVSGKGGVGKSVVASTLAWMASRRGKRTLLVELDTVPSVPRMFGRPPAQAYRETELAENLFGFYLEGKSGLEEYLHLVLKSGAFVRRIVRSPIYQYFVNVAPGLKELMAVGKLWDLEQKRFPGSERPCYDLIVVDTPATGHAVAYLQMPMAAAETAKGFVKREAEKVADLLRDPGRTSFHIVTTPAEMPVNEALDLHERARSRLRLPTGCLFVNQVYPPFFRNQEWESYRRWLRQLGQPLGTVSPTGGPRPWAGRERAVLSCAESWRRTRALQEGHMERLRDAFRGETVLLPFVALPEASLEMIRLLARSIEEPKETMKGGESAGPGP